MPRAARTLLGVALAGSIVAVVAGILGGISAVAGPLTVRIRNPWPPAVAALLIATIAFGTSRRAAIDALAWWWGAIERHAAAAVLVVAAVTLMTALAWGTYAAGGSDSYCYLNQAELFARGLVRDREPLASDPAWPGTLDAFVPAGHNGDPRHPGAFVPICPAGYPLLLAGAKRLGGRPAMFFVTPLLGAAAVWLAFVLGRRAAGPAAGLLAALCTASSPIVLYQVVQPMNDVPATALWAAALATAGRSGAGGVLRGVTAGVLTGLAITIRPNLLPLAAIVGIAAAWLPPGLRIASRLASLLAFTAAALPGILVVMAIQYAMYGSPMRSGYGDLSALFSAEHVLPNLIFYVRWVTEAHTPLVIAGFAAPLVVARGSRRWTWCLVAFAVATLVCYLPYVVFDAWWYQRFLLPAIPPLLALSAAVLVRALMRLPAPARVLPFVAIAAAAAALFVSTAAARGVFGLHHFEARFRTAGEYVATLPPDAVVITSHHSGSVRFYSGRSTAAWGGIEPGRLGEALAFLRARGRTPYILIESWEQPAFKARFAGETPGSLEWPHMVEIDSAVRIYDPADYDRYMRGERVRTERMRSQ